MGSSGTIWGAAFNSLSGMMSSSTCVLSESNSSPYHRHCGCALHKQTKGFQGSSGCSPVSQVKVANRAYKMRRSISASYLDENCKHGGCSKASSSGDSTPSLFDSLYSSDSSSQFESSTDEKDLRDGFGDETNSLTLVLMEDLARVIKLIKRNVSQFDSPSSSLPSPGPDAYEVESSISVSSQSSGTSTELAPNQLAFLSNPGKHCLSAPIEPLENFPSVLSPMEGNFYRCPFPGEAPYVRVGDVVRRGQVLCVIDTLKLITEIEADEDGTIIDVLPMDGMPVLVGTPIFFIRPHLVINE